MPEENKTDLQNHLGEYHEETCLVNRDPKTTEIIGIVTKYNGNPPVLGTFTPYGLDDIKERLNGKEEKRIGKATTCFGDLLPEKIV